MLAYIIIPMTNPFSNRPPRKANLDDLQKRAKEKAEQEAEKARLEAERQLAYRVSKPHLAIKEELEKDRREYQTLVFRLGLLGERARTIEQTGDKLGLTRGKVRLIEENALKRLEKTFNLPEDKVKELLQEAYQ